MNTLLRGDWRFFWPENLNYFIGFPQAWDSSLNTGIGQSGIATLWISGYLYITNTLSLLGLSWTMITLVCWILPIVLLCFFGTYSLFKYLFPEQGRYAFFAGILYLFNTYFLLILSGGQLGVGLAYSIFPFTIYFFLKLLGNVSRYHILCFSLVFSVLLLFDLRFAYMFLLVTPVLLIVGFRKDSVKSYIYALPIIGILVFLLHSYWIIPLQLFKPDVNKVVSGGIEEFKFFSFADFSHALTFIHPNWPDNIFGKVSFQIPQFLLVPLLAFSSYLFLTKKNMKKILCLITLLLVGVFLSKGSTDPLRFLNDFIFMHIPGMSLFRDPTKFYVYISVSFSMLLPFAAYHICELVAKKFPPARQYLFLSFIVGWLLLLFSSGNIKLLQSFLPSPVPNDYRALTKFISSQDQSFRTLWLPQWQRYGYFSPIHPAIGRNEFIENSSISSIKKWFGQKEAEKTLVAAGVKYVIIPFDSESEIFLTDRKFDRKVYQDLDTFLGKVTFLENRRAFGRIITYEVIDPKPRIWANNSKVKYSYLGTNGYSLEVANGKKGETVHFSEGFDDGWKLTADQEEVNPLRDGKYFMKFELPSDNGELKLIYRPQKFVEVLSFMSLALFFAMTFIIIREKKLFKSSK